VRSTEVIRDIDAVVNWIAKRTGGRKVALLGWATGGHWAGHYATLHSDKLTHLILYNMLYGGSAAHPAIGRGSDLEDPQQPGRFNFAVIGAYRLSVASSLLAGWDRSIPVEDKSQWRSSEVADAYIKAALESDPTSHTRTPPSFRAPSGALEDSFYQATGRQLWDAAFIRAQTLVIAAERDFWSRPEDRKLLEQHLVHARKVRVVVVPNATHFMHLDRPERGRSQFLREVINFLSAE
jgi:pimeloyl-ACP methyl ester carboxylesterase